jgi:hypothetical protein
VNSPNSSQQEMPRSAFRRAVYGDDVNGLIGRNTYYTDGREQMDLGLSKSIRAAQTTLILRLDIFNDGPRTWGVPVNDFANAFGRILSTHRLRPRTFQVGLRYVLAQTQPRRAGEPEPSGTGAGWARAASARSVRPTNICLGGIL